MFESHVKPFFLCSQFWDETELILWKGILLFEERIIPQESAQCSKTNFSDLLFCNRVCLLRYHYTGKLFRVIPFFHILQGKACNL